MFCSLPEKIVAAMKQADLADMFKKGLVAAMKQADLADMFKKGFQ